LHEAANKNLVAYRHGANWFSSSAARVAFVASAACNALRFIAFACLCKGILENVAPACAWYQTAISPVTYNTFNLILLFPVALNLSNGRSFVPFCVMQEGIIVSNYQRY
jgi:hypothetical protein